MPIVLPEPYEDFTKNTVVHAVQTAVAMDVITQNLVLNHVSPQDREDWFPPSARLAARKGLDIKRKTVPKDHFPEWPALPQPFDVHFRSLTLLRLMEILSEHLPMESMEAVEAIEQRYEISPNTLSPDTLVCPIALGFGAGVYTGLVGLDYSFLHLLAHTGCEGTEMGMASYEIAMQIAYLTWSLIETGFMSGTDLRNVAEITGMADALVDELNVLADASLDREYFVHYVDPAFEGYDLALYRACWFMMRCATAYKDPRYSTIPKENLPELLAFDDAAMEDSTFLFACLCAVSERSPSGLPYRLVVPVDLTRKTPYQDRINEIFKYVP